MEKEGLSDKAKTLLAHIVSSGEKWLIEEVERMFKEASDEEDMLEELDLYLTRLDMKIKTFKEELEKTHEELS
ncbi:MAG: hypothetical protein HYW47_00995 [Deltaproteobacteria bacterium]|nr:hypothetical protein [Deltaproteobacteria bacterium]